MSTDQATDVSAATGQIEALARALHGKGFATTVTTKGGYPCVRVANTKVTRMWEDVCAAPDGAGTWWLWWSWAERIVPVGGPQAIETAAWKIAYVLAPHGDPSVTKPPSVA